MAQPEIPPPTFLDVVGRLITRLDSLIEYIAKTEVERKQIDLEILAVLRIIAGVKPPEVGVPPPPPPPPAERQTEYYVKEDSVTTTSAAILLIREKELMKTSNWGYIYPVDGTIKVKINDCEIFTLDRGMIFEWHEYNLAVDKIEITTTSTTAVNYRLLAI